MTREEAINRLRELREQLDEDGFKGDEETQHPIADRVLCDLLTALGFEDVVAEFDALPKWYS